jgi:hypothetical protein
MTGLPSSGSPAPHVYADVNLQEPIERRLQIQWTYGVPKIRRRMSIRVKGYDFFSKSCQVCEPISHMILLSLHLLQKLWLTTAITPLPLASASCEWSIAYYCRERECVCVCGSSRSFETTETTVIVRPIDRQRRRRLRPIYDCFQLP